MTKSLAKYRSKRNFAKTREPSGKGKTKKGRKPRFVIQKHDASRLHYDFRLEIGGVLKSWAVPKGPSLNPRDKRLAVETEDHPLDYGSFEGVIPEGEYGGGTVMVWDRGTFRNLKDEPLEKAWRNDHLEVHLSGKKLKGAWVLTKMKGRGGKNWLLIKMKDDRADARRNPVSTEKRSAKSGRTLKEIERQEGGDGSAS